METRHHSNSHEGETRKFLEKMASDRKSGNFSSSDESISDEGEGDTDMEDFVVGDAHADDYKEEKKTAKKPVDDPSQSTLEDILKRGSKPTKSQSKQKSKTESSNADMELEELLSSLGSSAKTSTAKSKKKKTQHMQFDDDALLDDNTLLPDEKEAAEQPKAETEQKNEKQRKEPQKAAERPSSPQPPKPEDRDKGQSVAISNQPQIVASIETLRQPPTLMASSILDIEDSPEFGFSSEVPDKEAVIYGPKAHLTTGTNFEMFLFHVQREKSSLFLFGKAEVGNSYSTVCVYIENPHYYFQFLPKETPEDRAAINEEIEKVAHDSGCHCLQITPTTCKYAFDNEIIPQTAEWFCAEFSSTCDPQKIPADGEHYSNVLGITASLDENFLVRQRIYGPCWVQIESPKVEDNPISSCQMVSIDAIERVKPVNEKKKDPTFNTAMISVRSIYNEAHKVHEIFMISMNLFPSLDLEKFGESSVKKSVISLVCNPSHCHLSTSFTKDKNLPKSIMVFNTERELLTEFMMRLNQFDVDLLASYGLTDVDLPLILERMDACKVMKKYLIGRIRRTGDSLRKLSPAQALAGRIPVDVKVSCMEFLYSKATDLSSVVEKEINGSRQTIDQFDLRSEIADNEKIRTLIKYNVRDTIYCVDLLNKIQTFPLTIQISRLSACPWVRVLLGQASHRCETLLVHRFFELGFVIPEKTKMPKAQKRESKYKGGTVLTPKKGFYDRCIIVLDFNSLYPSVIREYNICFTTVDRKNPDANASKNSTKAGVLPKLMEELLTQRRAVKKQLATENAKPTPDAREAKKLNIRQLALKILANSMYGYLGYVGSRFKASEIAALVTEMGRATLQHAVEVVEHNGQSIIYGDTDSVMVDSGLEDVDQAYTLASNLQKAVNQGFKHLEIGVDNIFVKMLLVSKKKYAALVYDKAQKSVRLEKKGLDMVRRDWCGLTKRLSMFILDQFMPQRLSTKTEKENAVSNILTQLEYVAKLLRNNGEVTDPPPEVEGTITKLSKDDLIIRKSLSKPLEAYPKSNQNPHVSVALRMKERGVQVSSTDTIPYIITSPEIKEVGLKAKHPDEVEKLSDADVEWYLTNQILHPIWRLCEPFGDVFIGALSKALGLAYSEPNATYQSYESEGSGLSAIPHLRELTFECQNPQCGKTITIQPPFSKCLICPFCSFENNQKLVSNKLTVQIDQFIKRKSSPLMKCDGIMCNYEGDQIPLSKMKASHRKACEGSLVFTMKNSDFFHTLRYFREIFRDAKAEGEEAYSEFRKYMERYTQRCLDLHGFNHICLSDIFRVK